MSALRDRVGVRVLNVLAQVLLSRRYVLMVKGAVEYGLRAAARDDAEGRENPPDWRAVR
jgi:hypothetical protein